jgi:hypothetical protein
MEPSIELLGAYKVKMTKKLFNEAWDSKYGDSYPKKHRKKAKKFLREELSSIVLVEVLIRNQDENLNMIDFSQPGADQVAYDEGFLTLDGTELISRYKKPENEDLRIAFFLHFFDPSKPVNTSYGELKVEKIESMPERLTQLVPYRPVD